ncbi:MAG: hydroxymethylbilane synthase [Hyphomicrobiaceae bacterium]
MQGDRLRIGTRGSPLALVQAHDVRRRLIESGIAAEQLEIVVIRTSGDRIQDRPLSEVGGKGLFTKEIEEALLDGAIDLAVHSMKDVETKLPPGLEIAAMLPREDVRDAFISLKFPSLAAVPAGGVIGTSSLRRRAAVLRLRPDVRIVEFRGNVETRLAKLEAGVADATLLACAGLNRLGKSDRITVPMEPGELLPAVAQGAVGIEIRSDDDRTRAAVARLDDPSTTVCVAAERVFLARLDGSCRTPIAALARLDGNRIALTGTLLASDGGQAWTATRTGVVADATRLANEAAEEVLAAAGARGSN